MDNEKQLKQAQAVYNSIIKSFDEEGWKYSRVDDKLWINFTFNGEDLPMEMRLIVDPNRELVVLYSFLPFVFPQEKIAEAAIGTALINYDIYDGSFDLNVHDGRVIYRLTNSYKDSLIGNIMLKEMVVLSYTVVDQFNDKLFFLSKGAINLAEFEEKLFK